MQTLNRTIKLKRYYQELKENVVITEEQVFKPTNHKKWTPVILNHHTVLTYIETTQKKRIIKNCNHLTTQQKAKKQLYKIKRKR